MILVLMTASVVQKRWWNFYSKFFNDEVIFRYLSKCLILCFFLGRKFVFKEIFTLL